jgi:hypothetical protein
MVTIKYFFEGFKKGTIDFSKNIGIFLNLFLLSLVYFLGVGFAFLILKILGKKFLDLKINKKLITYWEERSQLDQIKDNFYRQF